MNDSDLRQQLKGYNWSSDKDYQLAIIAFRELAVTRKEVEEALEDDDRHTRVTTSEHYLDARFKLKRELRAKLLPPTKGVKE